jgi:hypothetical protein
MNIPEKLIKKIKSFDLPKDNSWNLVNLMDILNLILENNLGKEINLTIELIDSYSKDISILSNELKIILHAYKKNFEIKIQRNTDFFPEEISFVNIINIFLKEIIDEFSLIRNIMTLLFFSKSVFEQIILIHHYSVLSSNKIRISEYDLFDFFEIIHKIVELKYEGNPAELCIGIKSFRKNNNKSVSFQEILNSKKSLALFSGNRHILLIDKDFKIRELETLNKYPEENIFKKGKRIFFVPFELMPMAQFSSSKNILLFIITRKGIIYSIDQGDILYIRKFGEWNLFPGNKIVNILQENLNFFISEDKVDNKLKPHIEALKTLMSQLSYFYLMICLTMQFRSKGALIFISNDEGIESLEKYSNQITSNIEKKYQEFLQGKLLFKVSVPLFCNALSIDGCTIIDNFGEIKSFGNILNLDDKIHEIEGARTRAGKFASKFGLVIKISHDGNIDIYSDEKNLISF